MQKAGPRPARATRARRYHHGDLPRALPEAAVRALQTRGLDGLTIRDLAGELGVSRAALYRHFADKSALLAAVAREGFLRLRLELLAARAALGEDPAAIGVAYVRFAVAHPSHYRVMFEPRGAADLQGEAAAGTFQVLVEALAAQQHAGRLRQDDPVQLATLIWAIVHGIARLAIDGQLAEPQDPERLTRYALGRLRTGIAPSAPRPPTHAGGS